MGSICYWLSESEWGDKSQIPTSDNLTPIMPMSLFDGISEISLKWESPGGSKINFFRWGNISQRKFGLQEANDLMCFNQRILGKYFDYFKK